MAFEVGSYVTVVNAQGRENSIAYGQQLKVTVSDPERMIVYLENLEEPYAWVRFSEYPY